MKLPSIPTSSRWLHPMFPARRRRNVSSVASTSELSRLFGPCTPCHTSTEPTLGQSCPTSVNRAHLRNARTGGLEKDFNLTSTQYSIVLLVFFVSRQASRRWTRLTPGVLRHLRDSKQLAAHPCTPVNLPERPLRPVGRSRRLHGRGTELASACGCPFRPWCC